LDFQYTGYVFANNESSDAIKFIIQKNPIEKNLERIYNNFDAIKQSYNDKNEIGNIDIDIINKAKL
jgi:hypothetical protein